MKKIYFVVSRLKSNHEKAVAVFESEHLAKIYLKHVSGKDPYKTFHLREMELMDESREFVEIVLS